MGAVPVTVNQLEDLPHSLLLSCVRLEHQVHIVFQRLKHRRSGGTFVTFLSRWG